MKITEAHIEAAMVKCPKCAANAGDPCWEWDCRNGRGASCNYAICAYRKSQSEPHLQRAVAARKAATS